MAEKVLTWERFDTYVTERKDGQTYYARCGAIEIAGHYWEGFERLGRVALDEGIYPGSSALQHEKLGKVLFPVHRQMVGSKEDPKKLVSAEILFHSASVPSDLDGCVTAGWIYNDKMTESRTTMKAIWEIAGGTAATPSVKLTIRVIGARTPSMGTSATYLKGLKPYKWP